MQTVIQESDQVEIMVETRVTQMIQDEQGTILGVECTQLLDAAGSGGAGAVLFLPLRADHVILATGGFASDRSHGSYLEQYRPELLSMPATAGPFSTGDGITLATSLGAGLRDMEKVQIHPTGWVDPADPNNPNKVLAAELLRGVGGILINKEGKRFCNELGTRAYIADKMMSHDAHYAETKQWDPKAPVPTFYLVLSASAAKKGHTHVDLYSHKALLQKVEGVIALAEAMDISKMTLVTTLQNYQRNANDGVDEFGKTLFRGVPIDDLSNESFYVGKVIPVLHYCMGGITIDTEGNVLSKHGEIIPGLYGAGEVTGGVHAGNNRLGGNSLLECAVFGSIVGNIIPIQGGARQKAPLRVGPKDHQKEQPLDDLPIITKEELAQHNTRNDCWVAIHGTVYDLTAFASEHPGKSEPIFNFAGKDATGIFDALHSKPMLSRVKDSAVGFFENGDIDEEPSKRDHSGGVSHSELKLHNSSKVHPGGSYIIMENAGTDASSTFAVFHKKDKLKMIENAEVGPLLEETLYFEA
jgi:flavocytochrome c